MALGKTIPTKELRPDQLEEIPDLIIKRKGIEYCYSGKVLRFWNSWLVTLITDGCGFIAADLARVAFNDFKQKTQIKLPEDYLPSAFQVKILSSWLG